MDNKIITFRFEDWLIEPHLNQIQRGDETKQLEPLTMNVLFHLLENAGEVVTADQFLDRFWQGRNAEPGMVSRCVNKIRLALGDDAKHPVYIETIRKRGYRTIGSVQALYSGSQSSDGHPLDARKRRRFDERFSSSLAIAAVAIVLGGSVLRFGQRSRANRVAFLFP